MADHAATDTTSTIAVQVPKRTGATSGDTVPAGSNVLWVNGGAGSHTVTLTSNNTSKGLAVADPVITIPAGQAFKGKVDEDWGDANGRVPVAISGTASEVTYYVTTS